MRVSAKKANWRDYQSQLTLGRVPRLIYVAATRPHAALTKAVYMLRERTALKRLNQTTAGPALTLSQMPMTPSELRRANTTTSGVFTNSREIKSAIPYGSSGLAGRQWALRPL